MERANLEWLLRQATAYERWRAPIDGRLRRMLLYSGASIALALCALWALPLLARLAQSPFLFVLRPQLGALLEQLQRARSPLLGLSAASAAAFAVLAIATRGLRAGRATWHWAGLVCVVIGAAHGFVIALALGVFLLNLALWIIIVAFVLGILMGVFRRGQ
jgi:hypothetical protein